MVYLIIMEQQKKNLHHAYIMFGNLQESRNNLLNIYQDYSDICQWIEYSYESLGVDEVRELRDFLSQKKMGTFLVINAKKFSTEAQNAFLKILEEPTDNVYIFITLPPHVFVLETILSRVIVLKLDSTLDQEKIIPVRQFLLDSVVERLNTIEILSKGRDKDETLQAHEIHSFLDKIESSLYVLFAKKRSIHFLEMFTAIRDARKWAGQTSFPMKNILDYIAMVIPEIGKK